MTKRRVAAKRQLCVIIFNQSFNSALELDEVTDLVTDIMLGRVSSNMSLSLNFDILFSLFQLEMYTLVDLSL